MTNFVVEVERRGRYWAGLIVAADSPMLACEAAERITCQAAEGSLADLPDYFARAVKVWEG